MGISRRRLIERFAANQITSAVDEDDDDDDMVGLGMIGKRTAITIKSAIKIILPRNLFRATLVFVIKGCGRKDIRCGGSTFGSAAICSPRVIPL